MLLMIILPGAARENDVERMRSRPPPPEFLFELAGEEAKWRPLDEEQAQSQVDEDVPP